MLPVDEVMFHGQPVAWVLGEDLEAAKAGAAAVEVDYEPLDALVTLGEAIAANSFHGIQPVIDKGEAAAGLAAAPHVFSGNSNSPARSTSTWKPRARWRRSNPMGRSWCMHPPSTPAKPRTS